MWMPRRHSLITILAGALAVAVDAMTIACADPIYTISHFDVIPVTIAGVDFQQEGYKILFHYREASKADPGLVSFSILNIVPPQTNHSEIVQVWSDDAASRAHLANAHTVEFRWKVQGDPALAGGNCCVGSPIDDRQYTLVESFKAPWPEAVSTKVGPEGATYVITYVDFLQNGDASAGAKLLSDYGAKAAKADDLASYGILRQIDRPNRFVTLEIWSSRQGYEAWQKNAAMSALDAAVKPLLGSPPDHRVTVLCGGTFLDGKGCVAP
jgi:quinol monooxygenase YgiN